MRRTYLAAVGALAIFGASEVAMAQTVVVEPEVRTRVREYVVRERVSPARIEGGIRVGARLPADVELRPVPEAWGPSLRRYRYIYADERVYLVDPDDREVVHVID